MIFSVSILRKVGKTTIVTHGRLRVCNTTAEKKRESCLRFLRRLGTKHRNRSPKYSIYLIRTYVYVHFAYFS